MSGDLSPTLLGLIRRCVPTYQAAELLLCVAGNSDRDFSVEEAVVSIQPSVVSVPAVREYLALFARESLVAEKNGRFRYCPASSELERGTRELARAYNERPVTLILAIYHIGDSKIADRNTTPRTR
jgi:hypothetical protein